MKITESNNFVTTSKAASLLECSVDQIRRMILQGNLTSMQLSDRGPHMIPTAEILRHQNPEPAHAAMSFEDYCEINALNASKIKKLDQSLNHFLAEERKEQSSAFMKGSALHHYVELFFGGQKFEDYYVAAPAVDKRTKAGKLELEAFENNNEDKVIISAADYDDVVGMGKSVISNYEFRELAEGADVETVITFVKDDVYCKSRLDYCRPDRNLVIDLKSSLHADPYGFKKSVWKFKYDIQDVFYKWAYFKEYKEWPNFYFFVVENKEPYNTAFYKLSDQFLSNQQTDRRITAAIDLYRKYLDGLIQTKGYHTGILEI